MKNSNILFLISLVGSLALTSCSPDLSVLNIEVTQAIQDAAHSVPLISQRSTAVRVTVGTNGNTVNDVTGVLRVSVDGTEITPAGGLAPVAALTAVASPNRNEEAHTLNFELPSPSGIPASANVDFEVELAAFPGETNTGNNTGSRNDLTFSDRITPNIFYTRINYTPAGAGLPALSDVQAGTGDSFVAGIYPVNDSDPDFYRPGLFPSLNYSSDADGSNTVNNGEESDVLAFLASCRQLIVDGGLGAANNTFLYGWIAGNPISGNGWAPVGGFVAFGNTQAIRHQRTFAHELGHNFGLNHNSRDLDPETGWDVNARLDGNTAGNNTTGRVKPTTLNDIMRGGQLTNSAWVDIPSYNFFAGNAILSDVPDRAEPDKKFVSRRVAVIQGIFNREGTELISLEPVFRYPWLSQPSFQNTAGPYQAIIETSSGQTDTQNFDPELGDDSESEKKFYGFFEVMVPIPADDDIRSVRIVNTQTGVDLGALELTRPPKIEVTEPKDGATLGEETTVKWTVDDPDTKPEDLMFNVAYSPDNGRSWVPVGVRIRGDSFTFPSTEIEAAKERQGQIRVFVSDGLNTEFDDVVRLTTSAAQY